MIKKILFYVAAFAVSLVFATNAYAETIDYSIEPTSLQQVVNSPVTFASNDYSSGFFDNHSYSSNTDISKFIDNDLTTYLSMGYRTELVVYFSDKINLGSIYYNFKAFQSANSQVDIQFYNDDNLVNSYKTRDFYGTDSKNGTASSYINLIANGVNKMVIKNLKASTRIRELDLFVGADIVYKPITDVTSTVTDTTAIVNFRLPDDSNIDFVRFNGVDVAKSTSYLMKNLKADTEYKVTLELVYKDGTIVITTYSFVTDKAKDIIPPADVTDFKGDPDKTFVDLSWSLPNDEDYEKLLLYRDDVLIKTLTTETNYKDEKLNEDTTYKYKIITVDKSGNKSEGKTIRVLTKFTQTNLPPDEPLGLTAKPLSKGVKLSWKNPTSGSVKGYKIYMFEKDVASNNILDKFVITAKAASTPTQVNTGLLSSTSYQVSGLENGTAYGFYIVAVNSSGLSSVPSNTVYATPTINSVPPVNIGGGGSGSNGSNNAGFALSDVTSGVSTWFGGIWLILAFAIGIMVSFIIANRIKKLFVA